MAYGDDFAVVTGFGLLGAALHLVDFAGIGSFGLVDVEKFLCIRRLFFIFLTSGGICQDGVGGKFKWTRSLVTASDSRQANKEYPARVR